MPTLYTNASSEYDCFGTIEVRVLPEQDNYGRHVRQVQTIHKYHALQRSRYVSACFDGVAMTVEQWKRYKNLYKPLGT